MQKIVLILTILFSFSRADSFLLIKKGWQLIGSSVTLKNMSKFNGDNVDQVWHFDANRQKWLGYSPDHLIQTKMDAKGIDRLESLKNWHGFWIKSKKDWTLLLEGKRLTTEPPQKNKVSDLIELKKGWNLISLPVDLVVSAEIFTGMMVWKYNTNQRWELFDKLDSEETFPRVRHIKNSDGFWVKTEHDQNISVVEEASRLHNFRTKVEINSYIKERATLYQRPYCGIEPFILRENTISIEDSDFSISNSIESSRANIDATDTNLQESGVDESDSLKHNKKDIFYIGKEEGVKDKSYVNITSFEALVKGDNSVFKGIVFEDQRNVDSLYLVDNQLIIISHSQAKILVDMFDISDINNIQKVRSYTVDGYLKNSRVVQKRLYLISTFRPELSINYPKVYFQPSETCKKFISQDIRFTENSDAFNYSECYHIIQENNKYFRFNYDAPTVKISKLLPKIEGTHLSSQDLIAPQRLYASPKQNQQTTLTTISSFSLDEATYLKSTSYIGETSIEYASPNALYLFSYAYPFYYDFNNYKQRSMIYKFSFDDELSYRAVGSVYGTALNQFSLSEHRDILRLVTTEGFSWSGQGTTNRLYTLKENQGKMDIEGILSGLGKENERIKSVRFKGDSAYLVTFQTTDPLYTIDLSDPKQPKKIGELEVNGYSAYLHPVGEGMLLGIGQDTDALGRRLGVKIELFDISNFEYPTSLDQIVLPQETVSELEYNHKALAYRISDNLFVFPYRGEYYNLGIYQVEDNHLRAYESIKTQDKDWGEHRGLIFDYNNTTYVSFFFGDRVTTKILKDKQ